MTIQLRPRRPQKASNPDSWLWEEVLSLALEQAKFYGLNLARVVRNAHCTVMVVRNRSSKTKA